MDSNYDRVTVTIPTTDGLGPIEHTIQIVVYPNEEKLSIRQVIAEKEYPWISSAKSNEIQYSPLNISGFDAVKVVGKPFDPAVFISARDNIYFISLPYKMSIGSPPTPEAKDLFYEILDTFTIN